MILVASSILVIKVLHLHLVEVLQIEDRLLIGYSLIILVASGKTSEAVFIITAR